MWLKKLLKIGQEISEVFKWVDPKGNVKKLLKQNEVSRANLREQRKLERIYEKGTRPKRKWVNLDKKPEVSPHVERVRHSKRASDPTEPAAGGSFYGTARHKPGYESSGKLSTRVPASKKGAKIGQEQSQGLKNNITRLNRYKIKIADIKRKDGVENSEAYARSVTLEMKQLKRAIADARKRGVKPAATATLKIQKRTSQKAKKTEEQTPSYAESKKRFATEGAQDPARRRTTKKGTIKKGFKQSKISKIKSKIKKVKSKVPTKKELIQQATKHPDEIAIITGTGIGIAAIESEKRRSKKIKAKKTGKKPSHDGNKFVSDLYK